MLFHFKSFCEDFMTSRQIPVFLINLERSPARLERMKDRLAKLGLVYERIAAVDAKDMSESEREKLDPPRFWQTKKFPTEIACYASHLKVMRLIVERQLPRAIILEDDADFDDDFAVWIQDDCPIPQDTDVLKLEGFGAHNSIKIPISRYNNRSINFAYKPAGGAAAYILTLEGAKKAIKTLNIMREQIDDDLFGYWKNGLKVYEVFPFPAKQDQIDHATIRGHALERPLSLKLSRYVMKSYFKLKRFRYVVVTFGLKPFIGHYNVDAISSPKKLGIANT